MGKNNNKNIFFIFNIKDYNLLDNLIQNISISEIMQSAVTPVFLLAGIGALMNVMTGRLGRIIDRPIQTYLSRGP